MSSVAAILDEQAHRTSLEIQARLEENAPTYTKWIVNQARPYVGRRLLDVGCSTGNVTRHFADRDLVVGLDANPYALDIATATWANQPNVHLMEMAIPDLKLLDLAHHQFDTVTCINVIEHVADHVEALRQMAHVLVPGGRLFLLVPANPWLYGSMDAADHHYRRYTPASLRAAVDEAGLTVENAWPMNFIGAFGWFVNGRILRRSLIPSTQAGLYDKIIPFVERAEHAMKPPFGQSLVLVARK